MKFNLGDQVKIKSNGVVGIIIARGYNEYLNENDEQQSFEEYQIEADKYYQCNEDGIELCNPIIEESKYLTKDIIDCKMFMDYEKCKCETDNQNKTQIEDVVNHPSHYTYGSIEVMDYIEDKGFNFALGNAVKYISRAGRKDANKEIEDLEKANWYLNREIERLKSLQGE